MDERLLVLHWNEICIPTNTTLADLEENVVWPEMARCAFESFFLSQKIRADARISFSRGLFHEHVAGRSYKSWLEKWLGKDKFRKLKLRAVQPMRQMQQMEPLHSLDCELSVDGRPGEGITRAHLMDSWTVSLGVQGTESSNCQITALKTNIEDNADIEVLVRNLAKTTHSESWRNELVAWGTQLANNFIISEFNGYLIIMYPLDHGYPHLHVKVHANPALNAKYRVDRFEPLTSNNPRGLDELMEAWIAEHHESLQRSWCRCQTGKHPLRIDA